MKAFTLMAVFAALVATGSFAEAAPKTATGAVVSYAAADTAKATPATLVVKVAGKDDAFVIGEKTAVESKDKKAVDVAAIKAGAKVKVTYTEDGKALDAVSVTLQ